VSTPPKLTREQCLAFLGPEPLAQIVPPPVTPQAQSPAKSAPQPVTAAPPAVVTLTIIPGEPPPLPLPSLLSYSFLLHLSFFFISLFFSSLFEDPASSPAKFASSPTPSASKSPAPSMTASPSKPPAIPQPTLAPAAVATPSVSGESPPLPSPFLPRLLILIFFLPSFFCQGPAFLRRRLTRRALLLSWRYPHRDQEGSEVR